MAWMAERSRCSACRGSPAVSRLVTGQGRRPLADPVHRVLRAAAPPAQRLDPPGKPGLQVRDYLPGAAARRRAVGTSLQYHVEGAVPGAVLAGVLHHGPQLV